MEFNFGQLSDERKRGLLAQSFLGIDTDSLTLAEFREKLDYLSKYLEVNKDHFIEDGYPHSFLRSEQWVLNFLPCLYPEKIPRQIQKNLATIRMPLPVRAFEQGTLSYNWDSDPSTAKQNELLNHMSPQSKGQLIGLRELAIERLISFSKALSIQTEAFDFESGFKFYCEHILSRLNIEQVPALFEVKQVYENLEFRVPFALLTSFRLIPVHSSFDVEAHKKYLEGVSHLLPDNIREEFRKKAIDELGSAILPYCFINRAKKWMLAFKSNPFEIDDEVGLFYIQCLLQRPNREISVFELVAQLDKFQKQASHIASRENSGESHNEEDLKLQAKDYYYEQTRSDENNPSNGSNSLTEINRKWIKKFEDEIAKDSEQLLSAKRIGDFKKVSGLQDKIDLMKSSLNAVKSSGRPVSHVLKKNQTNVRMAFVRGLKKIGSRNSDMRHFLKYNINTGNQCIYKEPPNTHIQWQFEVTT